MNYRMQYHIRIRAVTRGPNASKNEVRTSVQCIFFAIHAPRDTEEATRRQTTTRTTNCTQNGQFMQTTPDYKTLPRYATFTHASPDANHGQTFRFSNTTTHLHGTPSRISGVGHHQTAPSPAQGTRFLVETKRSHGTTFDARGSQCHTLRDVGICRGLRTDGRTMLDPARRTPLLVLTWGSCVGFGWRLARGVASS